MNNTTLANTSMPSVPLNSLENASLVEPIPSNATNNLNPSRNNKNPITENVDPNPNFGKFNVDPPPHCPIEQALEQLENELNDEF